MAKKEGFTVDYNGNAVASVANQVTIINNAVQTGAGSIAISSVDPTGLDNALKQAQKAGLKVVTWGFRCVSRCSYINGITRNTRTIR